MKDFKIILFTFISVLLLSCNKGGLVDETNSNSYFYSSDKSKILYKQPGGPGISQLWDYEWLEVPADAKTFKVMKGGFGKDAKNIFSGIEIIDYVDYNTFHRLDEGNYMDNKNVYTRSIKIIKDANPKTYQIIKSIPEYYSNKPTYKWAKDDKHYFYEDSIVQVDYNSFEILTTDFMVDKDFIYCQDYDKFYKDTKNSKINNSKEMHKYTMRPYSVFGIKYYPFVANIGDQFDGVASWYGPDFHDKKTSNGETYNMYDMTAAHKTLPMNTVVKVDNLENGRSIIVRINDRGPFVRGRIIDLSNKAAHEIDMYRKGTAQVKITVLGYNGEIENKNAPYVENATSSVKNERIDVIDPLEIKEDSIVSTKVPPKAPVVNINKSVNNTKVVKPVAPTITNNTTPKVLSTGKYSIQVGAFSQEAGAVKIKNEYQKKFNSNNVDTKKVFSNGKALFKVFINGFESYEKAQSFKNSNGLGNALITGN